MKKEIVNMVLSISLDRNGFVSNSSLHQRNIYYGVFKQLKICHQVVIPFLLNRVFISIHMSKSIYYNAILNSNTWFCIV